MTLLHPETGRLTTGWDTLTTSAPYDTSNVGGPVVEDIVRWLADRKAAAGYGQEMARVISQTYGGRIAIPMPEVDKSEPLSTANFLAQGIDQHALRIARQQPEITYPSTKPGQNKADDEARTKRRASLGWWEINDMGSIDKKRARWLVAYASAPVLIEPDLGWKQPRWHVRSPLETYTNLPIDTLDNHPHDGIFNYTRQWQWVTRKYPQQALAISASRKQGVKLRHDDLVDIIEYVDDQVRVLICAGRGEPSGLVREAEYGINGATIYNLGLNGPNHWAVELERTRNRAGVCPIVVPSRINLDGPKGQFDDALGIFQMLAKMQAMNVNAIAKGIWPDLWLIHQPNATGRVVKMADGLRGEIGEIADGTLQPINEQPNPQVMNMLNYLERAIRQNAQLPAEFGGESPSNVRTNVRGLTVEGATVDYFLADHQDEMARAKKVELAVAQEIDKAYFRNTTKSFYLFQGGDKGRHDYVPAKLWAGDNTVRVSYAYVGMDVNAATVRQGQLLGMGAISVKTIMQQSPDVIEDPEQEIGRVWGDQLDKVIVAQLSQPGAVVPPDAAAIKRLVIAGVSIEDAIDQVHQAAQVRQASNGAPGTPSGPVDPGSPEAQPGLAPPGAGAEQPSIPPLAPSLDNYRGILQELGKYKSAANA